MQVKKHSVCEGFFRMIVRNAETGNVSNDTGWFKNLITDYGMNGIAGDAGQFGVCKGIYVGSSNAPPTVNDVTIGTPVARTSTFTPGADPSPQVGSAVSPYYAKVVWAYRFAAGAAAGNISEVGAIFRYEDPYELWSRSLVKDASGDPVTITILPDEILDVYYECRIYPQETFSEGTVTLMGSSYAYRASSSNLASSATAGPLVRGFAPVLGSTRSYAYSGIIGPSPARDLQGVELGTSDSVSSPTYVTNSFTRTYVFTYPPGSATGLLRSFEMNNGPSTEKYASELTPAFNKTPDLEFKLSFIVSWARKE